MSDVSIRDDYSCLVNGMSFSYPLEVPEINTSSNTTSLPNINTSIILAKVLEVVAQKLFNPFLTFGKFIIFSSLISITTL